ncbi:MAG: hypothetical protein LBH57_07945 [Treponema sp.]|nr:hypothetical protein [Treponema sp.]
MILLFSCTAIPQVPVSEAPLHPPVEDEAPYRIIGHGAGNTEESLPDWVARYIAGGIPGVEALSRYGNRYVFIAVNSGANFTALSQWDAGFTIDQDFPQLVSLRVLDRFTGDGQRNPDRDYGRYFESAVRTAADTLYSGVRREAGFWLLKHYESGDDAGGPRDIYDFYILMSTGKEEFQSQLNQVLLDAAEGLTLTRDQTAAVNRLRESFYEGF